MNIQELENKYKELGAEIERLKQQPEGVWEPTVGAPFCMIDWSGSVKSLKFNNKGAVTHHNVYKTAELAERASVLQRRSNLVIQACLNFDPDFVLNWNDLLQPRIGFYYCQDRGKWARQWESIHNVFGVYVSSEAIADKVLDYLNSQRIK